METELVGVGAVGGASAVLAIVTLIKGTVPIPKRFCGALAVGVGIALNVAIRLSADAGNVVEGVAEPAWIATILTGFVAGLAATGMWEFQKEFRNGRNPPASPPA